MPTYDYKCPECGDLREINHSATSSSVYHCKTCGQEMRKVYSIGVVMFKGGGWGKDAR